MYDSSFPPTKAEQDANTRIATWKIPARRAHFEAELLQNPSEEPSTNRNVEDSCTPCSLLSLGLAHKAKLGWNVRKRFCCMSPGLADLPPNSVSDSAA